ncbi:MAG: glycosyltransferase family 4 protein [Methanotrichaceae archaeon]|nr:glycosyltransferase family 4 protein [Methanotrichaceae archaeon]
MKILQTPARLFAIGGVERYVYQLSKQLAEMNHEVRVICSNPKGETKIDERISVESLRTWGMIANTNITPSLPIALLKEKFDILHTHLPTPWSADWSAIVSTIRDRPLVLTYHSDIAADGLAHHIAKMYNLSALRFLLEKADLIIVARKSYLSKHLERRKNKIVEIPMGVDIEYFKPLSAEIICDIFFLSLLDKYHSFKGLNVLFSALNIVKKDLPDLKLIVGGGGELKDYYERISKSMGLSENVKFVGPVPQEKLIKYYNSCKLFVLPSTDPSRETFGLVLLEAMACGKAVVATDVAGVAKDISDRKAGLVVKKNNEEELANALLNALLDEDAIVAMGARGRKLVEEKYTWKKVAEQTLGAYEELI